jgi:hypothetical protein
LLYARSNTNADVHKPTQATHVIVSATELAATPAWTRVPGQALRGLSGLPALFRPEAL